MADLELIFGKGAITGLPVTLIFNEQDGDGPPPAGDVTVSITAQITSLTGVVEVGSSFKVSLVAQITGLSGTMVVGYQSNTPRPVVGQARVRWQDAVPRDVAISQRWQQAQPLPIASRVRWQQGQPLDVSLRAGWGDALRTARPVLTSRYQRALPVLADLVRSPWQEGVRTRTARAVRYQEALRLPTYLVRDFFSQGIRTRRQVASPYQDAAPLQHAVQSLYQDALRIRTVAATRYQEAMRPPAGRWVRPVVPPQPDPCYLPELPVVLVFGEAGLDGVLPPLVFICERHGTGPTPGTVVVPIRRVYMTINELTLLRVDGAVPIPAYSFGMSLDVDSWTWQWSATLHASALPLIQPDSSGDPVDVLATINGVPYRLAAESYTRERRFPETRISVKGRGRAAILDAPYAAERSFGNTATRTAQQLMADVLTVNGVGIGWGVDWGITDWTVPGNVWTHQGVYMGALLDIADAAGAYIQPHDTDATLRVLSRYPVAPWDWASLTPDFELPSAAVSVEGIEWLRRPVYDRVHVSGVSAGVQGPVTRAGTTGGLLAPPITHSLITHVDAARQRGRVELSNTGRQAHVSLRLPVLAETGLIKPGALVRYVDAGTEQLGLVRSTSLEWDRPTLRQAITVETHPA